MNLSPNFTLEELLASPTASAEGFTEQFDPGQPILNGLSSLVTNALQPLRNLFGPLRVTSGYRCIRLNQAVGGEPTSQHTLGQAADIVSPTLTVDQLYQNIKSAGVPFDQLIIEHDGLGHRWVHVSYNPSGKQRGECFIGTLQPEGGTVVVADGIVDFNTA